jgi:perosamine synthetase
MNHLPGLTLKKEPSLDSNDLARSIQMAGPWITSHEERIVLDAVRNGWYGKNAYKYCELFEAEFAKYHGRAHALMTPNCTTALHLLLAGLGIGPGDEVIVPDCTWIGSAACITYQRATTVFADIDPVHWCVTPETIARAITPRTKAVIAVDLYGNMPDMDELRAFTQARGIHLIEDAAEAVGSVYKGTRAGKFGIGSAFSFHRTKTLTTGEGGMLLVDDKALFERCKFLRDHGRAPGEAWFHEVAFKYMPFNVQAALGYAQFLRLDELVGRKRWILESYKQGLAGIPDLSFNPEPAHVFNSVWCSTLVFGKSTGVTRDMAMAHLGATGMQTRAFFYPLSSMPAYGANAKEGALARPVAYDISARAINLPSGLSMTAEQIAYVCDHLRALLTR